MKLSQVREYFATVDGQAKLDLDGHNFDMGIITGTDSDDEIVTFSQFDVLTVELWFRPLAYHFDSWWTVENFLLSTSKLPADLVLRSEFGLPINLVQCDTYANKGALVDISTVISTHYSFVPTIHDLEEEA